MNIPNLIADFQQNALEFATSYCIVNGAIMSLNEIQEIFYNLFPMIYCKVRPNMTSRLANAQDKEMTKEILWDLYFHGVLRKSMDWAFQNEWRLILPFQKKNDNDYNIPFFPITKVYLGNRMDKEERRKIMDICNKKGIPYVGVKRNPHIFEMYDCELKCEDCIQYQNSIDMKS